jgi:hypothetical protein
MGIAEDLMNVFGGNTATPTANKSNIPSMQANPGTVVAGSATIPSAPSRLPKKIKESAINDSVKPRTQQDFNKLVKQNIEEQNLKSEMKPMSDLLKEQERKKLLNPESKNLVPDKKTSMMDRMKQLISSNIIIIEKEKIVKEVADSNDTSILFNKIQQLS